MGHFVLGVTGAVGAGKSTVCRALSRRGFAVLDVDEVAAEAADAVRRELAQREPAVLNADGRLDKKRLFAAMLADPDFRRDLERQLRPFVLKRIGAWIEHLRGPGALDAALLFESGLDALCTATLCVRCDQPERRRRVEQRTTASAQHFDALEAAQWPEAEKCQRADAALSTQLPEAELELQLTATLERLRGC